MRIDRLWVSKYKNIEDQWFEFENEPLITLLVGQNGLGKSNVIEAIICVMRQLDLAEQEAQLTTQVDHLFFDFEIKYLCKGNYIEISAKDRNLSIIVKEGEQDQQRTDFRQFKKRKQDYLPDNIITYYSGENKRIRSLFESHRDTRQRGLKRSSSKEERPLGKLFFVEENYGELLFLTLWIFKNSENLKETTKQLFSEFAGIEESSTVRVTLCNPSFYSFKNHLGVDDIVDKGYNYDGYIWNLHGDVGKLVDILFGNQLSITAPSMYRDEKTSAIKGVDEFIELDKIDFHQLGLDLLNAFGSVGKVFDTLEAAHRIGIIYSISTTIAKRGALIEHDFSELSEGEQQLLTVLGLLIITGEYDSLYLLDEPDTHLNPTWQRDYAHLLKKNNLHQDDSQIIVSTHSPLIVQSAEEADVFLFKRIADQIKVDKDIHRIHNWRLDQVLVSEYFGFSSARPPSLDEYMEIKEKILGRYPFTEQDEEDLAEFENEFGVLPTGETKTEIKALQLMNYLTSGQND